MPRPGGRNLGHAKHHVAFGRTVLGPRARLNRSMELAQLEAEEQALREKRRPKMVGSVAELFDKRKKRERA